MYLWKVCDSDNPIVVCDTLSPSKTWQLSCVYMWQEMHFMISAHTIVWVYQPLSEIIELPHITIAGCKLFSVVATVLEMFRPQEQSSWYKNSLKPTLSAFPLQPLMSF